MEESRSVKISILLKWTVWEYYYPKTLYRQYKKNVQFTVKTRGEESMLADLMC